MKVSSSALLSITLVALVISIFSPAVALGEATPQANARASPEAIAVIETGYDIELSVGTALTELGYAYDFYDDTFPVDYSVYDCIIQGMDGGLITQIPELAAFISAGGCAIILGGSQWEPFVLDVDAHLMDVDETDYSWTQVAGTPDITIVDPAHSLAAGLPATYDFVDNRATFYMLRIVDPVPHVVAENGDGYKAIVAKSLGSGKFTWFINSPADIYWTDPGDYNYLKTYLGNAMAWCFEFHFTLTGEGQFWREFGRIDGLDDRDTFVMTLTTKLKITVIVADCCVMGDTIAVFYPTPTKVKMSATSPNIIKGSATLKAGTYKFWVGYTRCPGGFPAGYHIWVIATHA